MSFVFLNNLTCLIKLTFDKFFVFLEEILTFFDVNIPTLCWSWPLLIGAGKIISKNSTLWLWPLVFLRKNLKVLQIYVLIQICHLEILVFRWLHLLEIVSKVLIHALLWKILNWDHILKSSTSRLLWQANAWPLLKPVFKTKVIVIHIHIHKFELLIFW